MAATNKNVDNHNPAVISAALKDIPGLFALMIVSATETIDISSKIFVYLINNTDTHYPRVKRLTGAFSSLDEDLMETGKRVTEMPPLSPHSLTELEGSDTGELDFVVWYNLDMTDADGGYHQYVFALPKPYTWEKYQPISLPDADQALIINLTDRSGGTIDDYVRANGLAPRYFEHKDGRMIQRE